MKNKFFKILTMCLVLFTMLFTFTACEEAHTHTFDKQVASSTYLASAANCQAKAKYYVSCSCGEKDTATFETGEKLDYHTYNTEHECSGCGIDEVYTEGLEYVDNEDGTGLLVSGIGTATDAEITIPSTYDGLLVVGVAANAFQSKSNITSLTFNYGVKEIEGNAFQGCTNLIEVNLPQSLKLIEGQAFAACASLTTIVIPASVVEIEPLAFWNCDALVNVYCEATSKPADWASNWCDDGGFDYSNVQWGYTVK